MDRPDRRRYFRINDMVGLSYRPVDPGDVDESDRSAENVQITSVDLLRSIDRELTTALDALWQSSPTSANAIGLLNRKLDILAAELDLDYENLKGIAAKPRRVNISACGIAFECRERFEIGQLLALVIVLKPANTHVKVTGRVIGCEQPQEEDSPYYLLRVDFDRVNADVKEQLIQHIVRRQSSQIGIKREEQQQS